MRKLSFFVLASLTVPTAGALALSSAESPLGGGLGNVLSQAPVQQSQASVPVPDRIVKFFGMSFTDTASWTCTPQLPSLQLGGQALSSSTCMACTNQGSGSADIVVERPPDGAQETISASSGSEVQICGDVLALRSTTSSSSSSSTTSPTQSSFGGMGTGVSSGTEATGSSSTGGAGSGTEAGASGSQGGAAGSGFGPVR